MIERTAEVLERNFNLPRARSVRVLRRGVVAIAAAVFVLAATTLVSFDSVFPGLTNLASLKVGDVAPRNIHAPEPASFISDVLTAQRKVAARNSVSPVYDPPDPNAARLQSQLARSILDFINDVRHDPFATAEQKTGDINQIAALTLEPDIVGHILELSDETWIDIDDQVVNVLERVMRESIRESDLPTVLDQLPMQVSVRFDPKESDVIVAVVEDLIRPNRFENPVATDDARKAAEVAVVPVERSFERGQIVIGDGERIDDAAFEALTRLGLLEPQFRRVQEIARAFVASIIVLVMIGLYTTRFKPDLVYTDPRMLTLLAIIFLITLTGARFLGNQGQVYIYPTAALALLFVTIIGPEIAIISSIGLALLIGLMSNNSLEIAALVLVGGLIGALTLRRSERLNSYFFAGLMIAVSNAGIVTIFNLGLSATNQTADLPTLVVYSLLNGILSAAAAIAGMYMVTLLFNLPTSLKVVELSQPNQPLLQRLLREAPGTYQHSLQVANLTEQATEAIGGNAALAHVSALYHDIGKMLNPAFFTENQRDMGNPHDILHDPYRSAAIIIGHVTEGDELARQYRLPKRVRDFIREHHGTTQVFVFYQQAINAAGGDESAVDIADFTYPGPKPQSRETAVMMLADSCEAAVRGSQPKNKKEIDDIVFNIIDTKRKSGQLDESGLTLRDLKTIQTIFVEMLQAVYHPRIDYAAAVAKSARPDSTPKAPAHTPPSTPKVKPQVRKATQEAKSNQPEPGQKSEPVPTSGLVGTQTQQAAVTNSPFDDDDDRPLTDVPTLPRTGEHRAITANTDKGKPELSNGKQNESEAESNE